MDGIINSMDMSLTNLREIVKNRGSLVRCSPWSCKVLDMTEQPKSNNGSSVFIF